MRTSRFGSQSWGGTASEPQQSYTSSVRRTQTAPSYIDPLVFTFKDIDDEFMRVVPDNNTLQNRLGLGAKEWQTILEHLQGIRLLPQHITVSHVSINRPEQTLDTVNLQLSNISSTMPYAVSARLARPRQHIDEGVMENWKAFRLQEAQISGCSPALLVQPSGHFTMTALLGVFLHYPTFQTIRPQNGEIAEPSNNCVRMLLKKGLNPHKFDGIVWWDLFSRRESTKTRQGDPAKKPPYLERDAAVVDLHFQWTKYLLETVNPRVVILFGRHVQQAYRSQFQIGQIQTIFVQRTPTSTRRVEIWLDTTQHTLVNRVLVCCPHPEAIYHRSPGVGKEMDDAIQIACDLARVNIPLNGRYFEWFETQRRQPTSFSLQSPVIALCDMLKYENEGDAPKVPFESFPRIVLQMFENWTGQIASKANMHQTLLPKCPEWHISLVKGLHIMMTEKAIAARRSAIDDPRNVAKRERQNLLAGMRAGALAEFKADAAEARRDEHRAAENARRAEQRAKQMADTGTAPRLIKCFVCDKEFDETYDLNRHLATKTHARRLAKSTGAAEERPAGRYNCSVCNYQFFENYLLQRHLATEQHAKRLAESTVGR